MKKYLAELQRRNVFRAIAAFVVFGWILLQAATALEEALGLPEWFDAVAAALLVLGFPVVLVLSWVYELTPDGLKKTSDIPHDQSITADTGRKLNYVTMAAVAILIIVIIGDRFVARNIPVATPQETSAVANVTAPFPGDDDKSIAVLPFKNLSNDNENEYFSDGVMEAILNDLARLRDVKVVSRTSVEAYRDTNKSVPLIGQELDVAHVLEGSVQRAGDRVRVTAQLIETKTDKHLWSSNYDRDISDIFKIQSEIATAISRNLELILTSEEKELMSNAPTSNLVAYDLYLMARHKYLGGWWQEVTPMETRDSIRKCEQAIELDPEFALAYVCVAGFLHKLGKAEYVTLESWHDSAIEYLNRALELKPNLWEAYAVLAGINFDLGDFAGGYYYANKVLGLQPNHTDFLQIASGEQYSLGQFENAVALALKSLALIPSSDYKNHSDIIFGNLAWLDPELYRVFLSRGMAEQTSLDARDISQAASALIEKDYAGYLKHMTTVYERTPTPNNLSNMALAYGYMGDFRTARKIYEQIISSSEDSDNTFMKHPFTHRLANAMMKTGDEERGLAMMQSYRDALLASFESGELLHSNKGLYYDLCLVYATLGDVPEAMRWLNIAKEKQKDGAFFDYVFLLGDTMLDPVRDTPEFKALMQELADWQTNVTSIFRQQLAVHQENGRLLWLTVE